MSRLNELLEVVSRHDGINDKRKLSKILWEQFELTRDRSVFYCEDFAIRFSNKGIRHAKLSRRHRQYIRRLEPRAVFRTPRSVRMWQRQGAQRYG